MPGSDKLRGRVDFLRQGLERNPLRSIADDDEARLGFKLGAGFEEQVNALAGLESADEEQGGRSNSGQWMVDSGQWPRGDGVVGDEDFLAREAEGGILVRAALTVGEQAVELTQEGESPRLTESS